MQVREREAAGIFLTHGLLDGLTTAFAAVHLATHAEINPLMRRLLAEGVGFAVGMMILVVGLLAAAWPTLAETFEFPRWFAPLLCAIGLVVGLGNVAIVVVG